MTLPWWSPFLFFFLCFLSSFRVSFSLPHPSLCISSLSEFYFSDFTFVGCFPLFLFFIALFWSRSTELLQGNRKGRNVWKVKWQLNATKKSALSRKKVCQPTQVSHTSSEEDQIKRHQFTIRCPLWWWIHFLAFRYVYKLCDLHLNVESYTEAGFTLLRRADDLKVTQRYAKVFERDRQSLYASTAERFRPPFIRRSRFFRQCLSSQAHRHWYFYLSSLLECHFIFPSYFFFFPSLLFETTPPLNTWARFPPLYRVWPSFLPGWTGRSAGSLSQVSGWKPSLPRRRFRSLFHSQHRLPSQSARKDWHIFRFVWLVVSVSMSR